MNLKEQDTFDKRFARRICMMIESRLIWYKHYYLWADEIILTTAEPPFWVLRISTIQHFPSAVEIINEFVYSEPFEQFNNENYTDEYVACLFLRYKRGEIAWATFLNEVGLFLDADHGHRDCGDFYHRLDILENNEYLKDIVMQQQSEVEFEYAQAIATIERLYSDFIEYFRQYVGNELHRSK